MNSATNDAVATPSPSSTEPPAPAETSPESPVSSSAPAGRWRNGLEWPAVLWIGLIHVGALAAPFCFTWAGLWTALALSWVTGGLGICLGFHRLLTHGSFTTYKPIRGMLALFGTLAGEGPPVMWVAAHRKHHLHSDQDGDPHSPRDGGWWSHVLWMLPRYGSQHWSDLYRRFAPDLLKDPFMRLLNRTFLWWHLGLAVILLAAGWLAAGWQMGVSLVVWGLFVRLVFVLHVTWCVNSASHMWGYRNYETDDDSRNNWWVGLLAYGEGWHNNHHAYQRSARHGHRWWELDATYAVIWLMERCGLAWNVSRIPPEGAATEKP
jgi:stearoyl-CoA desaturase (delta-9 desaturase)